MDATGLAVNPVVLVAGLGWVDDLCLFHIICSMLFPFCNISVPLIFLTIIARASVPTWLLCVDGTLKTTHSQDPV